MKKHAPGLNSSQLSSFKLLKGAKQLKFIECQLCIMPHVSAEKMFTSELNCLKKDGEVLRTNTGQGGLQK